MLKFEISYRGMVALGAALLTLWALTRLWGFFIVLVTSLIFMAALLPYVEWLCRRGLNRIVAVLAIMFTVLAGLGSVVAIVAPAMFDEFRDLQSHLPEYAEDFEEFMADFGFETERWDLRERAEEIEWNELISGSEAIDFGQRVALGVISAFTVIVLTAYLLVDTHRLKTFLFRFVPSGREREANHFLNAMGRVVGGYVRGQLITSAVIGVFTTAVLVAFQVDNAVAFGVLAAFADIIPLIGAFIAVIPAVVAAFQESPTTALFVLILLLLYQQFEDRFLVPKIYGQTLNLPALVVLIAVLVGGELMGIAGILLALPAAAAGRVVLDYYLDRREGGTGFPEDHGVEVLAPDLPPDQPPDDPPPVPLPS